ncbi:MAG: extracellular solute-binding protein [Anaerolineales bacterium]|nr:extracellular solute-binding protein [Anaerolineales bacterium]
MKTLEYLTIVHDKPAANQVVSLLDRFKDQSGIEVETKFTDWDTIWRELVSVSINRKGADITEVGTSWLESLVTMNSLRPFTQEEIIQVGGKNAFLTSAWEALSVRGDNQVWGIPLRSDVRVVWYWKDMLEEAGVDPDSAFKTYTDVHQSLETLKSVIPTPWGVTTVLGDPNTIQVLASWVWGSGHDFVMPDGKMVSLDNPAALGSLKAYFDLHEFMPRENELLTAELILEKFSKREIAATVAGPWVYRYLKNIDIPKRQLARVGVALPPGPPFVGGTVLAAWNHSTRGEEIVEFLKFMTSPDVQTQYCPMLGLLPVTHAAWALPPYSVEHHHNVVYQALSCGRTFPSVPLWGMVEEKILTTIAGVWSYLLTTENPRVEETIIRYFDPVINRLNLSLSS